MGNSLRCCLGCVLPCGALDLIRIIHLNGTVEEIKSHYVTAGNILRDRYPNHVLAKPFRPPSQQAAREMLILSPHSQLKRGTIYFLIPAAQSHKVDNSNSSRDQQHYRRRCSASDSINAVINKSKSRVLHHRTRKLLARPAAAEWRPYLDRILEEH